MKVFKDRSYYYLFNFRTNEIKTSKKEKSELEKVPVIEKVSTDGEGL